MDGLCVPLDDVDDRALPISQLKESLSVTDLPSDSSSNRQVLIHQISKLLKDRLRLSRLHSKAERQIAGILQAKKENEEIILPSQPNAPQTENEPISQLAQDMLESNGRPSFPGFDSTFYRQLIQAKEDLQREDEQLEKDRLNMKKKLDLEETLAKNYEQKAVQSYLQLQNATRQLCQRQTSRQSEQAKQIVDELNEDLTKTRQQLQKHTERLITAQSISHQIFAQSLQQTGKTNTKTLTSKMNLWIEQEALMEQATVQETNQRSLEQRIANLLTEIKLLKQRKKEKLRHQTELEDQLETHSQELNQISHQVEEKRKTQKQIASKDLVREKLLADGILLTQQNK